MSQRCFRLAILIGIGLLALTTGVMAERPTPRTKPGWVGLYTNALIDWLENENRLNSLCAHTASGTAQRDECRKEMLKPRLYEIQLRKEPHANAMSAGTIVVEATPGRGLRAFYRPAPGAVTTEFVPDLYDVDWGYGPYFHQTFLDQRGSWFLLPAAPLPRPAWVNPSEFGNNANVRMLRVEDIVTTPSGDLFVLGIEAGAIRARAEQEVDMWCEEGDPPPLQAHKEILIEADELYSETGHLLVHIKYTRGC